MLRMNRYKDLALGIVRRWYLSGEFLVDEHVTLGMMGQGFMVVVVGPCGSGKSILASQIARRLHENGSRAPAMIDELAFNRFIDKPRRIDDHFNTNARPFARIREMACRTHTPVVVNVTLRPLHLRPPTQYERSMNRLSVLANHDLLLLSDLIWMTEKRDGEFYASLMKSRTMSAKRTCEVRVQPNPGYRMNECPYFIRGTEMARQIEQRYG